MINNTQKTSVKWQTKRLKEFVKDFIVPMRDKPKKLDGEIPWCRIEDFNGIYLSKSKSNQGVNNDMVREMNLKVYPVGTVLVSCSADLGRCAITKVPLITNQTFIGLVPSSDLDSLFLYYLMSHSAERLNTLSSGTTISYLSRQKFENLTIEVPSFGTQQKIASILSTIDKAIQKTDQIIEKTEKLKNGVMQGILEFGNADNMRYMTLGDIGKVSMCKRIFKNETLATGDIPFYKIGTFGKEPDSYISQELYDNYHDKYPFPKNGDVLLSASGTIGRKVKFDGKPSYFQDSNIIWLEHDESKVLNDFLFYLYDTITWQTEGSTIKRLYNNIFLKKIIPVPPIERQIETVEILLAIGNKISANTKLREGFTLLKNGLMNDIFSQKMEVN